MVTRSSRFSGYGNCIIIKHDNGFETLYSHQAQNLIKAGDKVKAGQVIGLTGRTGRATTEHLHFEIYFMGRRLNPAILFDHTKHCLQKVTLTLPRVEALLRRKTNAPVAQLICPRTRFVQSVYKSLLYDNAQWQPFYYFACRELSILVQFHTWVWDKFSMQIVLTALTFLHTQAVPRACSQKSNML